MFAFVQTALSYLLSFVLVLTLVVTIHELGHFYVARLFGTAIDRFSIGFGKAIAQWKDRHGVEWRIGWIPLGGYVRFSGDENAASVPDQEDLDALRRAIVRREGEAGVRRYFHFKPLWQRALVVGAGPVANFLLAITIFTVLLMTVGQTVTPSTVSGVRPGSPAAAGGFQRGDLVVKAGSKSVSRFDDLSMYIMLRANVPIDFTVDRHGELIHLRATPVASKRKVALGGEQVVGVLGLEHDSGDQRHVVYRNPFKAVAAGAAQTWDVVDTTVYYLGRLVRGQVPADQLGGPLGIAQASGAAAHQGAEGAPNLAWKVVGAGVGLLYLAALLSVSVGFMNLLPIPVLDGGHLLFYAYEAVARRPLAAKIQAAGYRVGLALLLGFMLFATWNDLQRLSVFKVLGGLFS